MLLPRKDLSLSYNCLLCTWLLHDRTVQRVIACCFIAFQVLKRYLYSSYYSEVCEQLYVRAVLINVICISFNSREWVAIVIAYVIQHSLNTTCVKAFNQTLSPCLQCVGSRARLGVGTGPTVMHGTNNL